MVQDQFIKAAPTQEQMFEALANEMLILGSSPHFAHLIAVSFKLHLDATACEDSVEFFTTVPRQERAAALMFVAQQLYIEARRLSEQANEKTH